MDQQLQAYIDSLVLEVLQSPNLSDLNEQKRQEYIRKLLDHFNNVIFDTTVDMMSDEQLSSIKGLPLDSPEMPKKMMEIAAKIPGLAEALDKRLRQEVEALKNNPKLLPEGG